MIEEGVDCLGETRALVRHPRQSKRTEEGDRQLDDDRDRTYDERVRVQSRIIQRVQRVGVVRKIQRLGPCQRIRHDLGIALEGHHEHPQERENHD